MTRKTSKAKTVEPQASSQESSPVYFLSLELSNVLCFKTPQKIDLTTDNGSPAQWTVILGDNGVGKTTLLRCLAGMKLYPSPLINKSTHQRMDVVYPDCYLDNTNASTEWIKTAGLKAAGSNLKAEYVYGVTLTKWQQCSLDIIESQLEKQFATIECELGSPKSIAIGGSVLSASNEFSSEGGDPSQVQLTQVQLIARQLLGLQCYGYGANRLMGETSLSETWEADSAASLFLDHEPLINAEEWLLQADYAVARSTHENSRLVKRFDLIKDALKRILPEVEDIQIALASDYKPRPTVEFLTPYGWVPLSGLGLGYRTVAVWIVDLAVRMIEKYPFSDDPLSQPAVVLVDEIDLHLHPKWQREIMQFLTERFPNVQFIVTTHSPLVVQAAKDANIVLLRREEDQVIIDNDPKIVENWRADQILTSMFDLPTPYGSAIEPLIQRRRELLGKPSLTRKDEQELKQLEQQIGYLPTAESPTDIQAMDIIRKAAKLLENQ
jgi:predicted ATPase